MHKNVLARPRRTKSTARTGPGLLAGATCDPRPARGGCSRLTISCQANTRPPKGTQGTPPGLPRPRGATRSRASEHPEKQQSSKASVFDADYFGELGKFCRTARAQTHARGTPYRRGKKTCNGIFSCWRLPVVKLTTEARYRSTDIQEWPLAVSKRPVRRSRRSGRVRRAPRGVSALEWAGVARAGRPRGAGSETRR